MMTERLACKTPGCSGSILPSTSEATGGLCRPCFNAGIAAERKRYIAAHRVDVDRFAGISDVVEIIRRIHIPPPYDPLKKYLPYSRSTSEVYRGLQQIDADRLVREVMQDRDCLCTVATHLASFASVDMAVCQNSLLDEDDPYPAHAFRNADSEVVGRLFSVLERSIEQQKTIQVNHCLCALAWTRSRRAIESMISWQHAMPEWSKALCIPPHQYSTVAGYEIVDGTIRELIRPGARRIVAKPTDVLDVSLSLFLPDLSHKICTGCGSASTLLVTLDAPVMPPPLLALGSLVAVPTCLNCSCFEPVFVRFLPDGTWDWAGGNVQSDACDYEWPLSPAKASLVERPDWEVLDWCIGEGISQLGGYPTWINDSCYPACPDCSRLMLTLGQVSLEDFLANAEGVYYVHGCEFCPVVAVSYQQS